MNIHGITLTFLSSIVGAPDSEEFEQYGDDGAKVGEEMLLDVRFHSQPEPYLDNFKWYAYGLSEPLTVPNATVGRYTAYKIEQVLYNWFD